MIDIAKICFNLEACVFMHFQQQILLMTSLVNQIWSSKIVFCKWGSLVHFT